MSAAESTSGSTIPNKSKFSRLRNHWSTRPIGVRGYYWLLTFESTQSLQDLARRCQVRLDFPFYDPVAPGNLHLTLDRVAGPGEMAASDLDRISRSAMQESSDLPPLDVAVDGISAVRGAVAFDLTDAPTFNDLRTSLRAATLRAQKGLALAAWTPRTPHVTIAYANSDDISADTVLARIEELDAEIRKVAEVRVRVDSVALVTLERLERSYSWNVHSRIPLTG